MTLIERFVYTFAFFALCMLTFSILSALAQYFLS
jgi:hypothetical protein